MEKKNFFSAISNSLYIFSFLSTRYCCNNLLILCDRCNTERDFEVQSVTTTWVARLVLAAHCSKNLFSSLCSFVFSPVASSSSFSFLSLFLYLSQQSLSFSFFGSPHKTNVDWTEFGHHQWSLSTVIAVWMFQVLGSPIVPWDDVGQAVC